MGAVQFIENLDRTSLTVSDEEFEKNVEAAVSEIAEKHREAEEAAALNPIPIQEKSTSTRQAMTPRHSMDGESSTPRRSTSQRDAMETTNEGLDEKAAVAGLLRTIQKPLSTIGRIFSDDSGS